MATATVETCIRWLFLSWLLSDKLKFDEEGNDTFDRERCKFCEVDFSGGGN